MKKFLAGLFERLAKSLGEDGVSLNKPIEEILSPIPQEESAETILPSQQVVESDIKSTNKNIEKKPKNKQSKDIVEFDPRDMMELMEVPFLALSKNRTKPIVYESKDGKTKVKVSAHREHYLASIYDWDIVECIAGKMQEMLNSGSDIPPKTLVISRNKLLKALHKKCGKTNKKEIEESLKRLKLTGIETTIRNEDYRYSGGFGFLDSWGYTERKDVKEFRISLSDWLYDGICKKGALLKISPEYFELTSGLKKFLYRTARKHVGKNKSWKFSLERLYEKSGSEREFKKFKHDLKKAILDNDIPEYFLQWGGDDNQSFVLFINKDSTEEKNPKKLEAIEPNVSSKDIKDHVNSVVASFKMPSNIAK
jgi:plasmid replication initiation protein